MGLSATRRRLTTLSVLALASACVVAAPRADAVEAATRTPVAQTPPMGWNSWNAYGCDIDASKVKKAADALVSSGMKDAGYNYVVIDDCWSKGRDAQGNLIPDPAKFPDGIKSLADYVHSKGLKFGMYAAPMTTTCADYTGSFGHERQDADNFAAWGVDYLKYDWCDSSGTVQYQRKRFAIMRDALKATGRPIVYSINPGSRHSGEYASLYDYGDYGNLTRIGEDLGTQWWTPGSEPSHYQMGTLNTIDLAAPLTFRSGPQRWNDWDMLQAGNGMPVNEARAQFTMWAIGGSPLIAGNDVTAMSAETAKILTNKALIRVDQSWGGSAGRRISLTGDAEVWAKPLANGDTAVALLNRGSTPLKVSTTAAALNAGGSSSYRLTNLWTGAKRRTTGTISAKIPGRDVVAFRVHRLGTTMNGLRPGTYKVSGMHWLSSFNPWGPVERDRSNGEQGANDGSTLSVGGTTYRRGLGTNATSAVNVWLGGTCDTFTTKVGVDDDVDGRGSVQFQVYGDGRLLASTGVRLGGEAAKHIRIPVRNVRSLELRATTTVDGGNSDHADWLNPRISC